MSAEVSFNKKCSTDRVAPETAAILTALLCFISGTITGDSGMKKIKVANDRYAIVDDDDYMLLKDKNWYISIPNKGQEYCYAGYCVWQDGAYHHVWMHRVVTGAQPGQVVDHVNSNTLDNRKSNLRVCTLRENALNSRPRKNTTSKYKGVSRVKSNGKWYASIKSGKKSYNLGVFESEEKAAKVYDEAAFRLFGEYAYLNFPKGGVPRQHLV